MSEKEIPRLAEDGQPETYERDIDRARAMAEAQAPHENDAIEFTKLARKAADYIESGDTDLIRSASGHYSKDELQKQYDLETKSYSIEDATALVPIANEAKSANSARNGGSRWGDVVFGHQEIADRAIGKIEQAKENGRVAVEKAGLDYDGVPEATQRANDIRNRIDSARQ